MIDAAATLRTTWALPLLLAACTCTSVDAGVEQCEPYLVTNNTNNIFKRAAPKQDRGTVKYIGSYDTLAKCIKEARTSEKGPFHSFTYHTSAFTDPRYHDGCYADTSVAWGAHGEQYVTSGRFSCFECKGGAATNGTDASCTPSAAGKYSQQAQCAHDMKHGRCGGGGDGAGSVGPTVLLIFGAGLVLPYLLVGSLVQWRCRGKRGMGAMPNREFWLSVPSLAFEGCRFSLFKLKGGGGGSGGGGGGGGGGAYEPYEVL